MGQQEMFEWDDETWAARNDPEKLREILEQRTKKPYKCDECGVSLSFPETIWASGLTYCKEHYPSYDRHEQW